MEHRGLVRAKEIVPCNTILEVWKQKKHCTNKVIYKIDNRIESRRTRDLSRDFPVMVPFVFILLSFHWTFWIYGFSFHKIGNIYSHYLTFFSVSSCLSSFRNPVTHMLTAWYYPTWHCCSVYFCLVGTLCTPCCSSYCYVHKFNHFFCTVYSIDNPIWCICHFRSFSFSEVPFRGFSFISFIYLQCTCFPLNTWT